MGDVLLLVLAWVLVSMVCALVVGRLIALADQREGAERAAIAMDPDVVRRPVDLLARRRHRIS